MKILQNVRILNVTEDLVTRVCTIETDCSEFASFEATKPVHHGLVDLFFDNALVDSYSFLIDADEIAGITPSGSQYEAKWREVYNV